MVPWGIIFASQGPQGHPTARLYVRIRIFIDFSLFLGSSWEPLFYTFVYFFMISGAKMAGCVNGLFFSALVVEILTEPDGRMHEKPSKY